MHDLNTYASRALPHLENILATNQSVLKTLEEKTVRLVKGGGLVHLFGSGHSSILAFELFHRAGGPSFVNPIVADFLLPTAGPPVVRQMERTANVANALLNRARPQKGEMLWLFSQSGINPSGIDFALEAKNKHGLCTVAFTSLPHSQGVDSRHASGKKLYEVVDHVIDLGGVRGDAAIPLSGGVSAGPLSSLTAIFLAHSLMVSVCERLEAQGHPCVYTSVNTPEGDQKNKALEAAVADRIWLLRD